MDILYVVTRGDSLGGAQRNVLDQAEFFAESGRVAIASSFGGGPLEGATRRLGIPFYAVESLRPGSGPRGAIAAVRELTALAAEFKPDVIHAHSTMAGLFARIAGWRLGVPSVFTAHGWVFTPGTKIHRRVAGVAMELVARPLGGHVLCVSQVDLDLGRRLRIVPNERLHHVPYGISDLSNGAAVPTPRERDTPVAVMAARFEPQKDHETLLRGLALLKDIPWKMVLAGDGRLMGPMQSLADELGIADRVEFLGFSDRIPELLADSDVFVLITNYEGLPISIMEALRAGRPVVGTDVSGIPEMVVEGQTGWLAERGNPKSAARALRRAFTDRVARLEAGRNARAVYEREYTLDQMAKRVRGVYELAVSG